MSIAARAFAAKCLAAGPLTGAHAVALRRPVARDKRVSREPLLQGLPGGLDARLALMIFCVFAFAYFFSTLVRAVIATLAPVFSSELGLAANQLGLLAGAYFLGFSMVQLPLGSALDRWGAKRVLTLFLAVAVLGCVAFAAARSLTDLLLARFLVGVGVAACLMAPLTCFRHRFSVASQLRANSWMLMSGSLGMLASTLPVQWLLPSLGWRGLFVGVAALLLLAMALIWRLVPADEAAAAAADPAEPVERSPSPGGYRAVFSDPAFLRLAPMGFFVYGGMIAMRALWIGPWLTQVGGRSAKGAAQGLFLVSLAMLLAFLCWGLVMPWRLSGLGSGPR